ncbi:(d)CMP kinase [Vineibacter terrae]|uniref:Cytidylate kinase n=1 Tax=Vineibacter terrae TaxID=2586908 RepID=A0A5C8PVT8_9HYPH|nr:(d)CMP kinase [Vineibacter terrae]TXL81979.1 (d)CMP kinase [Vineibacter terrae]
MSVQLVRPQVIALDGPSAAGKGTLARRLASHYDLAHLDTGSLYRAVGRRILREGRDPKDATYAAETAANLQPVDLKDPELRSEATSQAASIVAAIPAVRANLLAWQREFAKAPPDGKQGVVLDGRDIGTVICPDADVKLFVTASPEARAERRFQELQAAGANPIRRAVLDEMASRDRRDSERATAPLLPADGAFVLDTSDLDADAVFDRVVAFIESKTRPRRA